MRKYGIHRIPFVIVLPVLLLFAAACGDRQQNGEHENGQEVTYEVKGRYLSTGMRGETISVIHETIPDVMNAMRMNFRLEDESEAEELATGDIIRFETLRTDAGWYARNIEILPPDTPLDLPEELQDIGVPANEQD